MGYSLNFFSWLPEQQLVGTAGRAVDHVGFDVRNLEAFCWASNLTSNIPSIPRD